jgi:hypothetical protein
MNDWERCSLGSCVRHERCMYHPCRAIRIDDGRRFAICQWCNMAYGVYHRMLVKSEGENK